MTAATITTTRPALLTAHTVVSGLLVVLILVQATIAGQYLFSGADIALHGYVGNASFTLGLVAVGLALAGRLPGWLFALTGMVALLMFAQTGTGYLGRDTLEAASWHVPLGVLIFGLATWQLVASAGLRSR